MIEMKINAVSASTLVVTWTDESGAECRANVYRTQGGSSIDMPSDFHRTRKTEQRDLYGGTRQGTWRSFGAAANKAEREALRALVDATDCHAMLDQYSADYRAQRDETARTKRIEALRAAFNLIGGADTNELSEAISADWREAEKASAAIYSYVR